MNVVDDGMGDSVDIVDGKLVSHFGKIEPNSNAVFSYVVVPKSYSSIQISPAKISYKENDQQGTVSKTLFSSDMATVKVLTKKQFEKKYEKQWIEWIKFIILAGSAIGAPLYLHLKTKKEFNSKPKSK